MKVAFLNSAKSWGGNERWMFMATEILKSNQSVILFGRSEEVLTRFQIPVYKFPFLSEIDLFTLFLIIRQVKRSGIQFLIPTKRKESILAGIAGKLTGAKVIQRVGINRDFTPTLPRKLMYRWLCDGIIVNARAIKESMITAGLVPEEKIRVIYNGILVDEIKSRAGSPPKEPNVVKIVSMGELSARKGHDHAIRGLAKLKLIIDIPVKLQIIGSGNDRKTLETLASDLNLSKEVEFTGFIENPYPMLATADIFLMVSAAEGISNAMLEAMILGVPVVTTAAGGGAGECIQHRKNGWLLAGSFADEMAEALQTLILNEPFRKELAENGKTTVTSQFDISRMGREISTFLSEIADNGNN